MSKKQLETGMAVAAALIVVAVFFIFQSSLGALLGITGPASAASANNNLVVQDEVAGTGALAQPGDRLTVDYTGKLQNGAVFNSSIGKAPIPFTLGAGQVIPGWDQGLQGMRVGGKRLLIISPSLGYGSQQYGPIPANSTLVFEVSLLSVQKPGVPSSNTASGGTQ